MEVRCAYRELLNPKSLKPHPANPNEHGQDQIDLFVEILKYQGWRRPITVSIRSGFITKGHGALAAAMAAGCELVPVDYQDYTNEAQELADIVADNQLARLSKMSNIKLQNLIVKLDSGTIDLELTGLKLEHIESLMTTVPGWNGAPHAPADDSMRVSEFSTETEFAGGPAHDEPHLDHWQSDIEKARKEVDDIEANTDGIVATIKISCPQPLVTAFKEQLKEFLEMIKDDFEGVAIA